jgi:hypothetical protein
MRTGVSLDVLLLVGVGAQERIAMPAGVNEQDVSMLSIRSISGRCAGWLRYAAIAQPAPVKKPTQNQTPIW